MSSINKTMGTTSSINMNTETVKTKIIIKISISMGTNSKKATTITSFTSISIIKTQGKPTTKTRMIKKGKDTATIIITKAIEREVLE